MINFLLFTIATSRYGFLSFKAESKFYPLLNLQHGIDNQILHQNVQFSIILFTKKITVKGTLENVTYLSVMKLKQKRMKIYY